MAFFDVTAFGAKGDGAADTNDFNAIKAARDAAGAAGGGVVYLPKGTYAIHEQGSTGLALNVSNLTIRGEGRDKSVLKASGSITPTTTILSQSASDNVTIEDLTLDGNGLTIVILYIYGFNLRRLTVRRCRFINMQAGEAIQLSDSANTVVEDCVFESLTPPLGRAIYVTASGAHLTFRNCRFRYVWRGIQLGEGLALGAVSDEKMIQDVTVDGCHFDGGWFHLPVRTGGHTGTATFSYVNGVSTMTRTSGPNFPSILPHSNFRLMRRMLSIWPPSPTLTAAGGTYLDDSSAQFTTYGLVPGDIVRAGSKFGIVMGVESNARIRVEEWLDDTTRQPVAPPTSGSYAAFKTYHGKVSSVDSADVITVYDTWTDRLGNIITATMLNGAPSATDWLADEEYAVGAKVHHKNHSYNCSVAGTSGSAGPTHTSGSAVDGDVTWDFIGFDERELTYELLPDLANYQGVSSNTSTRDVSVTNCVFLRGYGDQISLWGDRSKIIGNLVDDGQDTGITVNGRQGLGHSLIHGNVVRHHGANGIYCSAEHSVISSNVCTRNQWLNTINVESAGDMTIGGSHSLISGNLCDGEGMPQATYGIVVGNASNCVIANNRVLRHSMGGLKDFDTVTGAESSITGPRPRNVGNKYMNNDTTGETVAGYLQSTRNSGGVHSSMLPRVTYTPVLIGSTPGCTLLGGPADGIVFTGRIKITLGGARGTAKFQYSPSDGTTYNGTDITTAASIVMGPSDGWMYGITVQFASATYVEGDVFRFNAANAASHLNESMPASPVAVHAAAPGSVIRASNGVVYTKTDGWGISGWAGDVNGQAVITMSDANHTATATEAAEHYVLVDTTMLTAQRDLTLPNDRRTRVITNSGGTQSIRIKPAVGAGTIVTIAAGQTKVVVMINDNFVST